MVITCVVGLLKVNNLPSAKGGPLTRPPWKRRLISASFYRNRDAQVQCVTYAKRALVGIRSINSFGVLHKSVAFFLSSVCVCVGLWTPPVWRTALRTLRTCFFFSTLSGIDLGPIEKLAPTFHQMGTVRPTDAATYGLRALHVR